MLSLQFLFRIFLEQRNSLKRNNKNKNLLYLYNLYALSHYLKFSLIHPHHFSWKLNEVEHRKEILSEIKQIVESQSYLQQQVNII